LRVQEEVEEVAVAIVVVGSLGEEMKAVSVGSEWRKLGRMILGIRYRNLTVDVR
jgi:hypothetical protein